MHSSGSNTNASTQKRFQPHNFSVKIKKCSWQEHCSITEPSEVGCSGGSLNMNCMYFTQNILHARTYIYVRRYITQCVSYTWLAGMYRFCYHSTLLSLSGPKQFFPPWCSELQQFQRFAMWITFAAKHPWSHNTERMESSAGTERLLTNEQGGTIWAAGRAAWQVHGTA